MKIMWASPAAGKHGEFPHTLPVLTGLSLGKVVPEVSGPTGLADHRVDVLAVRSTDHSGKYRTLYIHRRR